jgi:hypothetical protein
MHQRGIKYPFGYGSHCLDAGVEELTNTSLSTLKLEYDDS